MIPVNFLRSPGRIVFFVPHRISRAFGWCLFQTKIGSRPQNVHRSCGPRNRITKIMVAVWISLVLRYVYNTEHFTFWNILNMNICLLNQTWNFKFHSVSWVVFLIGKVRRHASQVCCDTPIFSEKTFPGSVCISVLVAAWFRMGSGREKMFVLRLIRTCPRPEMFAMHPPYWPSSLVLKCPKCRISPVVSSRHQLE